MAIADDDKDNLNEWEDEEFLLDMESYVYIFDISRTIES